MKTGQREHRHRKARKAKTYPREPHDFYIEKDWASELLFRRERFAEPIWDPACGSGNILATARRHGYRAVGSDLVEQVRGVPDWLTDFRAVDAWDRRPLARNGDDGRPGSIVCNPPWFLDEQFMWRALTTGASKIAMLVRLQLLETEPRSIFYEATRLARVYVHSNRVSCPPGSKVLRGEKMRSDGGEMALAWFVWERGYAGADPGIRFLRRSDLPRGWPAQSDLIERATALTGGAGIGEGADGGG